MSREHRVTHPVLGVATWREIQSYTDRIRQDSGKRLCSWCHQEPPKHRRTICSNACAELIRRVYQYDYLVRLVVKRDKCTCRMCGKRQGDGQVDHIVPVSLGGLGDIENLRFLCTACHGIETARLRRDGSAFIATPNLLEAAQ